MKWWEADPSRLERERTRLQAPWRLTREAALWRWTGDALHSSCAGVSAPPRRVAFVYPSGFPARCVEVRLIPDPARELWGRLGTHLNNDGSACVIAAEGWTPQMTVADTLHLAQDWWFNYWVIVENDLWFLSWPSQGKVTVPPEYRAALSSRKRPRRGAR